MIFILLAFVIGVILAYLAYTNIPAAPAQISQTVPAYDNQFEVFRDMEPADQTLENSWVGFLQENVRSGRTGPIGDFIGNDSDSGKAPLFYFDSIQEPGAIEATKAVAGQPVSKVILMDSIKGTETELGPGTHTITPTTSSMKVYPPLLVVAENSAGIKQTTRYVAGNAVSNLVLDQSYKFTKITLSVPS
jgi:hypothetical protein